ncbi:MAG TPA: hypothetical protein PKJ42_02985 [Candidatus Goldiibacteriota bacterium]|nr:hypothetical protein [Candidatus Goldiibacteriota bacterium]
MQIFLILILLIVQPAVYFIKNSRAAFLLLAACGAGIFAVLRAMGIDGAYSLIFVFFSFAADILIFRGGEASAFKLSDILPLLFSGAVLLLAAKIAAAGLFAPVFGAGKALLPAAAVFLCLYCAALMIAAVRGKE